MVPSMSLLLLPPSSWKVFWSRTAPATDPFGAMAGCSVSRLDTSRLRLGSSCRFSEPMVVPTVAFVVCSSAPVRYLHRLCHSADLQREIDRQRCADGYLDLADLSHTEPRFVCSNFVSAGRHVRENIPASVVGGCRPRHTCGLVLKSNRGAKNGAAGRVGHESRHTSRVSRLSPDAGWRKKADCTTEKKRDTHPLHLRRG